MEMKHYTIGILFDDDYDPNSFRKVAVIEKNRPEWQKGLYNFPGGHVEENESSLDCVIREFREEAFVTTDRFDWRHIGKIRNADLYDLDIFTARYDHDKHGPLSTQTDEQVYWKDVRKVLEYDGLYISNVPWLVLFAKNYWKQGNADQLKFGTFEYSNE